jgi:hypothetical protein
MAQDNVIREPIPRRLGEELHRELLDRIRIETSPPLPVVNWASIGQSEPTIIQEDPRDPPDPLPRADAIIITWTEAEWAALDHVMCDSGREMPCNFDDDPEWKNRWHFYSRGWDRIRDALPPNAPSLEHQAWGKFCRVKLPANDKTALLFKSDMHISTDGETLPLRDLIRNIIEDVSPNLDLFLTIGTAGGTRTEDFLGTTNISNTAKFDLSGDLSKYDFNHKEFTNNWTPDRSLLDTVNPLLVTPPVTMMDLRNLADEVEGYTLNQLINKEIIPDLLDPQINVLSLPVLTSNGYEVGDICGNYKDYACLEMDDAVIAMISTKHDKTFGIVRNISDPVQNADLPKEIQQKWGAIVYKSYGFYTSFNGVLAAWAVVSTI